MLCGHLWSSQGIFFSVPSSCTPKPVLRSCLGHVPTCWPSWLLSLPGPYFARLFSPPPPLSLPLSHTLTPPHESPSISLIMKLYLTYSGLCLTSRLCLFCWGLFSVLASVSLPVFSWPRLYLFDLEGLDSPFCPTEFSIASWLAAFLDFVLPPYFPGVRPSPALSLSSWPIGPLLPDLA